MDDSITEIVTQLANALVAQRTAELEAKIDKLTTALQAILDYGLTEETQATARAALREAG